MKHILSGSLCLATAALATANAQSPLGTFTNMGTTYATRGGAATPNTNPATLFVRHDMESYAGFTTGVTPGTRDITGLNFVIQDENLATQDSFAMVVYTGDPAMPNFPLVATPLATSGNFVLPLGTGGLAYNASANFATPVSAPATEDVYVALQFNTAWTITGGAVTDGMSVWEHRAQTSAGTQPNFDAPGPRIATTTPDGTFGGYYCANPVAGPAYPVFTQYKIQPIVPISGGVACTLTNQTANHVESTAGAVAGFTVQEPGAGTASMFSGLYPDAANPPLNAGRADTIGQLFLNASLPAGSLVFFMINIGGFGPFEVPATNFIPGSTGVSCLDLGTMQVLGFGILGANGRAFRLTPFPAAVRSILGGFNWSQQAVGLNITTNTIHATACTIQRT